MIEQFLHSLRGRLLARLSAPIIFVVILSAIAAFGLARHIGAVVYDRWLQDSAGSLARQIRFEDGHSQLRLPSQALEMFAWDSVDDIFAEVRSSKDGRIFGKGNFAPAPPASRSGKPVFYDTRIDGYPVRAVAVRMVNPNDPNDILTVQVAETRRKRDTLFIEVLSLTAPVQALLLLVAGVLVWLAVTSGLRALNELAQRLAGYDSERLVPLSDVEQAPTEIQPLLASLNHLIARLAESQETQRRFIANAAHQLRTPLAALQMQTERALREQDPVRREAAIAQFRRAVTRARRLLHQLLTLARSERGAADRLQMVPVDLAELARDELESWADAAITQGADLGYEGPEHGAVVLGDAHLLHELLGNLLDNALRYGGTPARVTLTVFADADAIHLCVDDEGPGIAPSERELVLERFYRCPDSQGEGCGLGLAIAKEIMDRHRGELHLESNPRQAGLRVRIVLARQRAPARPPQEVEYFRDTFGV